MSNVAPEHGETPFGAVGTGVYFPVSAATARPPAPSDPIGAVSDDGPSSMSTFSDPNDSDNDMDTDGPGDMDDDTPNGY